MQRIKSWFQSIGAYIKTGWDRFTLGATIEYEESPEFGKVTEEVLADRKRHGDRDTHVAQETRAWITGGRHRGAKHVHRNRRRQHALMTHDSSRNGAYPV